MKKADQVITQTLTEKAQQAAPAVSVGQNGWQQVSENLLWQPDMQEAPVFSDGIITEENLAQAWSPIPGDEAQTQWLTEGALDLDAAHYTQVAENTYPGIYDQVDAVAQSLPEAEAVEAGEVTQTASKLPYILIGSGLLLSGLAVAAGGGSGKSSDKSEPAAQPDTADKVAVPDAASTPKTETPVVDNPAVETPVVEEPKAETPAVDKPAVETPVVEEPKAETPVVDNPAVETPVVEEPKAETPVVDKPAVETPVVEEPKTETPVVDKPAVETPVVEEPKTETPVVDKPAVETPVVEEPKAETPVVDNPAVETPVVEEPKAETPVVDNSAVETPVVDNSAVETPVVEEPKAETPVVDNPAVETPVVEEPKTETPVVDKPAVETPVVEEPKAETPVVDKPAVETPVVEEPKTETPVVDKPAVETPVVEEPKTETPVVEKPAVETPVVEEPKTEPVTPVTDNTTVTTPVVTVPDTSAVVNTGKQSGLTLDIAKHFYSADVIKQYIDVISAEGGTYLQLHLSDDDNYAFESKVLNQLVGNATLNSDGTYTNNATGKQFLSFEQIADITAYAKAKGVELIPEIDTPNHMDAIFKLLEMYQGADYVKLIKSEVVDDEIDITSEDSLAFVQSLYSEVIGLMEGSSKHFHIGGDEFGYSTDNNHEFITYANEMAAFLASNGLTTRMWNDGLLKTSLASLDKNIEITYWSYDGNPTDSATAAERRTERASMDDLLDNGFDVLNYNWYYLYFVPDSSATSAESGAHMASDIQARWELGLWDGTSTSTVANTGNVIGASLSIWGENAGTMSDDEIFSSSVQSLTALISKVNALSVDTSALSNYALQISDDTPVNAIVELDSQLANLVDISMTSEISANGNSFVWLNGNSSDMVALTSDWVTDGTSALKDNVSYTLYKNGQNHLYIDTDIAVTQAAI